MFRFLARSHLLVKVEHLIVRDNSWVAEVVDSRQLLLGHCDTGRKELVKDCHGIGHVNDPVVLDNLGDKVTRRKVIGDGHADAKDKGVLVDGEHLLDHALCLGVPGRGEVSGVLREGEKQREKQSRSSAIC